MRFFGSSQRTKLATFACAVAMSVIVGACASTPPASRVVESDLLPSGFKVLVATDKIQEDWVRNLTPGQINPMQRTGKKYFIYPDAANNQVYVGGPEQFEAYLQLHPEYEAITPGSGMAGYVKQSDAMRKASARDLSDPWLGVGWGDLIY
jgi:hypothetical protein